MSPMALATKLLLLKYINLGPQLSNSGPSTHKHTSYSPQHQLIFY
jgi:hypothetical protein